jgi:hypothetical protein
MMKKFIFLIALAGSVILTSCDTLNTNDVLKDDLSLKSGQIVMSFNAHLTGAQEVPPKESDAVGQVILKLSKDGTEISYKLIVANIVNVTAAHIHMAPIGTNGGVVFPLYTSGLIEGKTNGILAEGVLAVNHSFIESMMEGNTYVNVHTSTNPSGEIRGQISMN